MNTRFIVVAGGVISGVGKGVTTASLGKILQEYGYQVTLIKIDPYINYDAGTLRPTEHGEVWVTQDGGEIDQDLGTYERFINIDIPKKNNITTGQIYKAVIDRERMGQYLGQTVQFIPHILDEIKHRILQAAADAEIAIIELGGTVGDYENTPFLFALKALEREIGAERVAYCLVTYLPIPDHTKEMKTKPTQQAIRLMGQEGVWPDFIICRAKQLLDEARKKKIECSASVSTDHIICAPDIEVIYQMPLLFEEQLLGQKILRHFKLPRKKEPNWQRWQEQVDAIKKPQRKVKIAIVGKYLEHGDYNITDSYISIYQALIHAGSHENIGFDIEWINATQFEQHPHEIESLSRFDGIIVPGGFGAVGVEGKIAAINYARIHQIPFLGLCYGLQLAIVEFARNMCDLSGAHTTEVDTTTCHPVVTLLPLQQQLLHDRSYGGTMRLGAYKAVLEPTSHVAKLYMRQGTATYEDGRLVITERHRNRYEVNPDYLLLLQKQGLLFSGFYKREDGTDLVEFIELEHHPFFIATQAHPEFSSRFEQAHPLFVGFAQACVQQQVSHIPINKPLVDQQAAYFAQMTL